LGLRATTEAVCGHLAIASLLSDVIGSISAVKDVTSTTQQAFAKCHLGLVMGCCNHDVVVEICGLMIYAN
jgi:hypothetical protein